MSIITLLLFGVFSSLIAVWLYITLAKYRTWRILRKLNGVYRGFDLNGKEHRENKKYKFIYHWKNVMRFNNVLILEMTSTDEVKWKSEIIINDSNPLIAVGTFKYDKEGIYSEDWGMHEIQINEKDKEIYIHTTCLSRKSDRSDIKYIIKSKN